MKASCQHQSPKNGGNLLFILCLFLIHLPYLTIASSNSEKSVNCPCEIAPLPDYQNKELTARWMVHSLNWGVLTTISSRLKDGQEAAIPFGNVYSFVDGTCQNSTGIPYFYGTYMDQSFKDTLTNTNAALTLSEASLSSVCLDQTGDAVAAAATTTTTQEPVRQNACQVGIAHGDAENPVCARLTLTGKFVQVTDPEEKGWALQALFTRHSSMKDWPQDHAWVVGKLVLSDIWLIDFYGGASILDVDAYYQANDFMNAVSNDRAAATLDA